MLRRIGRIEWLWGTIFALPAILLISLFVAYPIGTVIYYGFTRWNGLSPAEWVGIHNYRVLLDDQVFRQALKNNFLFALSVPIQMTAAAGAGVPDPCPHHRLVVLPRDVLSSRRRSPRSSSASSPTAPSR